MCYVYLGGSTAPWIVGFFNPGGKFIEESKHEEREAAAKRVHYLNGGN